MVLSPYGEPKYTKLIKDNLIDIKDGGSFASDMNYFHFCTGDTMTNSNFNKLFGSPLRKPETELTP
jgi:carbamoyltransferase